MTNLKGKVVWLTGASSGIGEELAYQLSRHGAVCAISARREAVLDRIAASINEEGGKAHVYAGDVTDLAQMKEVAARIESELGPIELLIANAGTHVFTKPAAFDSSEYLDLMNLNFGGMLHCIEAVLPNMLQRNSGHIAGMASLAGFRGLPRAAAYGASKAAMAHFLESIRFHLEEHGIQITIINPGFVRTPLTDKNDFHMPFLTEPDRAARIICRGLRKRRKEISFPVPFSWTLKLMRIVPFWVYEPVVRRVWKSQASHSI